MRCVRYEGQSHILHLSPEHTLPESTGRWDHVLFQWGCCLPGTGNTTKQKHFDHLSKWELIRSEQEDHFFLLGRVPLILWLRHAARRLSLSLHCPQHSGLCPHSHSLVGSRWPLRPHVLILGSKEGEDKRAERKSTFSHGNCAGIFTDILLAGTMGPSRCCQSKCGVRCFQRGVGVPARKGVRWKLQVAASPFFFWVHATEFSYVTFKYDLSFVKFIYVDLRREFGRELKFSEYLKHARHVVRPFAYMHAHRHIYTPYTYI